MLRMRLAHLKPQFFAGLLFGFLAFHFFLELNRSAEESVTFLTYIRAIDGQQHNHTGRRRNVFKAFIFHLRNHVLINRWIGASQPVNQPVNLNVSVCQSEVFHEVIICVWFQRVAQAWAN